jgi:hypothetical protein
MAAALVSYITSGMFQDMTIIAMVHMLLFVQAGIVRGLLAKTPQPQAVRRREVSGAARPEPQLAAAP